MSSTSAKMTPMLTQYYEIKQKYPETILLFRLGDFYEMFDNDAIKASKILDITLTARYRGTENETPMCGIPHHALPIYLSKLIKAGEKAAICEQLSDPSLPGIVKRQVVQVVTSGTTLDNNILSAKQNNYLVSLEYNKTIGMAVIDLTTGEFKATEINTLENLSNELHRLSPAEIIISARLKDQSSLTKIINAYRHNFFDYERFENAEEIITKHFKISGLESFGLAQMPLATIAAARLLRYLRELEQTNLAHVTKITPYAINDFMLLDEATIRNLELFFNNYNGTTEHTLLEIIDHTQTPMGGRLIREWLLRPLLNVEDINHRLSTVSELTTKPLERQNLNKIFDNISDLERLAGRIGCAKANPKDLKNLAMTLEQLPELKNQLALFQSYLLQTLSKNINLHEEILGLINKAISDDAPIMTNEGGIFNDGYNAELDELRNISRHGKEWISAYQTEQINLTKINSLKVKFNNIFGYYIEISKANASGVPDFYERKQTLVNAERFTTPELKEYESKVLGAQEKINLLESKLFNDLIVELQNYLIALGETARQIAMVDVLTSLATVAALNNYVKPEMTNSDKILIKDGRHPVIEQIKKNRYVPNNLYLDQETQRLIILTGPNMSGKSSYIRQNALIVLLSQIGSFVPASVAQIGIVDRIFTRVGASDNLSRGQSTFMVEMQEAANIINNATSRSFIILDELGRGTSTYDGVSIAWAIAEYIYHRLKAKTLFATHYHELINLASALPAAENYSVQVKETDAGEVVFLHEVQKGGVNKSYGIEVAKLAGLPQEIILQAQEKLMILSENNNHEKKQLDLFSAPKAVATANNYQSIIDRLKSIDLDNITPLEAHSELQKLKNTL